MSKKLTENEKIEKDKIRKEKKKLYMKEYRKTKSTEIKLQKTTWRLNNKDKIKIHGKKYRENYKIEIRERKRLYELNKRKNDILHKLKGNIRTLIGTSHRNKNLRKNTKTENIIGCSYNDFKLYLESKFENWMNWDNYGKYNGDFNYGWDIDHIIPLNNAKTEEDVIKLNHYTNLQPLCSHINRDIKWKF